MNIVSAFLFCFLCADASPEEAPEVSLDLLESPTSPSFSILGVSPSHVDKLIQPKNVRFLTNGDTQKMTVLPNNYAFELAPYYLFNGSEGLTNFSNNSLLNPLDGTTVSFATSKTSDIAIKENSISLGYGVYTVITRGELPVNTTEYINNIQSLIIDINNNYTKTIEELLIHDIILNKLNALHTIVTDKDKKKDYDTIIISAYDIIDILNDDYICDKANNIIVEEALMNVVYAANSVVDMNKQKDANSEAEEKRLETAKLDDMRKSLVRALKLRNNCIQSKNRNRIRDNIKGKYDEVNKEISSINMHRSKFKSSIAGAWAFEYVVDKDGKLLGYSGNNRKWAGWGTVEYDVPDVLDFIGCLRYTGLPHAETNAYFDAGTRIVLNQYKEGLAYSIEYIGRVLPNSNWDYDDWRLATIFDFCFAKNTVASISLGRDFGNSLCSSLNFSIGIGTSKKVTKIPIEGNQPKAENK